MTAGPAVIVFDFDGTLYESEAHFDTYAEHLAASLDPVAQQRFRQAWPAVRAGAHPLRVGRLYDPGRDWVLDVSPVDDRVRGVLRFDGTAVADATWRSVYGAWASGAGGLPEGCIDVGDPWALPLCLFLREGGRPEAVAEAFRATRRFMVTGAFDPQPVPGLVAHLEDLRGHGHTLILATNTPEAEAAPLLARLQLAGAFDRVIFEAGKPMGLGRLLDQLIRDEGVLPGRITCIGDNYRNDVRPGWVRGCVTLFVDRYGQAEAPATARFPEPRAALAWLVSEVAGTAR